VVDGKYFAFVGTNGDAADYARARVGKAIRVDMGGRLVLPGFNDSHMHYLHYIKSKYLGTDLGAMDSVGAIQDALKAAARRTPAANGGWIIGEAWNQDNWADPRQPFTCRELDEVSTELPIIAIRVCCHVGVLNTKAMRLLGLDERRAAELGHCAGKFDDGRPNGIIKEYALDDIKQNLPAPNLDTLMDMLIEGQQDLFASGITSIQSDDLKYVAEGHAHALLYRLRDAAQSGRLKLRMSEQCLLDTAEKRDAFFAEGFDCSFGGGEFGISCVKLLLDGSLGARTALMTEPYADEPSSSGIGIYTPAELDRIVAAVHRRNMPIAIHAIGDKAIDMALEAIEKAQTEMPYLKPRHGIVHCQITDAPLLERFKKLGVTAFVQPVFIDYDMDICASRVGKKKAATSYAWKTLYDAGVCTAFGTDCPVEPFDVMRGIWCAVSRQKVAGSTPFNPAEAMPLYDALCCYTAAGAYAEGQERSKGIIRAGMLADFAVLDRDIFALPPEDIRSASVVATYIGGERVYAA
jgi:hypothetical protein